MKAPTNRYSIAFGHFLIIHASEPSLAEVAPPKRGLLGMIKPMKLHSYDSRDKFSASG
jgi:hypothetical protein